MTKLDYEDRVWVDDGRKLEGICDGLRLAQNDDENVLIIAHFESTLAAVETKLRARSTTYHSFFSNDYPALCSSGSRKVWLALASYFQAHNSATLEKPADAPLAVLVAEHHPMASKDRALLESLSGLPCRARIVFHVALTDALLTHFGGEKLQDLLERLGHEEEIYISHTLISAAIRNAQEKVDRRVHNEMRAWSANEWVKYNLR